MTHLQTQDYNAEGVPRTLCPRRESGRRKYERAYLMTGGTTTWLIGLTLNPAG